MLKNAKNFLGFPPLYKEISLSYSTPRAKTDKLEEPVNRELNVTRSWNFIQVVDLAWFIAWMNFKLICIFYNFKAPLLENRWFSDFKTCIIRFSVKNHFQKASYFSNYDKFWNWEFIQIMVIFETHSVNRSC